MSCTCVILAGGTSLRMKEDKALLFDNVNQLNRQLTDLGFTTVIACGNKKRVGLFDGNCIPDSSDVNSLPDVIRFFVNSTEGEIQFFPCDMYLLSPESIQSILNQSPGIPVDHNGREQYTLARTHSGWTPSKQSTLRELFVSFPRNDMREHGIELMNFNHPEQLEVLNKLNR